MAIKYTTKPSTRFLLAADCYLPKFGGYVKRGEYITVPAGTPMSRTWTEVDESGDPVKGGQVAKKLSRHVERPKGDEDKTIADLGEEGAKEAEEPVDDAEPPAAPTPPAAPKHAKPARAAAAPKHAKKS